MATIPAGKLFGLVIAIQMEDFRNALATTPELKDMIGNPHTCCFQWSMMTIMALAAEHGKGHRLRFILEVNDIKGDAQRTFDYVVQNHNPKGIRVSLAFGTKGGNPPLQAADVLAYEGGKYLKEPGRKPRRAWTALDPDNTRIISYCYRKENMSELIEELSAFPENLPVSPSR